MTGKSGWWRRMLPAAVILGVGIAMIIGSEASSSAQQGTGQRAAKKQAQKGPPAIGYDDTPMLPDQKWRVHDIKRPHPRVITPGGDGRPPSDAIVLFDGKDLSHWVSLGDGRGSSGGGAPGWKVENGYLEVGPGTGAIATKEKFGDCQLHIEWASPTEVTSSSQGRGNSGVMFMGRYEIQVLDSYQNVTYADGQAASIYGQYPPLVNAARPPGEWQTYDIVFEAPRFEGEKLVKPAFVTLFHNGVVAHNRQQIIGGVRHREVATYAPHPAEEPLVLQDHRNRVRFRNVWVRRLRPYDEP